MLRTPRDPPVSATVLAHPPLTAAWAKSLGDQSTWSCSGVGGVAVLNRHDEATLRSAVESNLVTILHDGSVLSLGANLDQALSHIELVEHAATIAWAASRH